MGTIECGGAVLGAIRDVIGGFFAKIGHDVSFESQAPGHGIAILTQKSGASVREEQDITGAVLRTVVYPVSVAWRTGTMTESVKLAVTGTLSQLADYLGGAPVELGGELLRLTLPELPGNVRIERIECGVPAAADAGEGGVTDRVLPVRFIIKQFIN